MTTAHSYEDEGIFSIKIPSFQLCQLTDTNQDKELGS